MSEIQDIQFDTSADYARFVEECASRSMSETLYSGEYLKGLAGLLKRELDEPHTLRVGDHADIYLHYFDTTGSRSYKEVMSLQAIDELDFYFRSSRTENSDSSASSAILFIRGHQVPQCLTKLGAKFNIDPRVYLRHLDYRLTGRSGQLFSTSSLASAALDMLRLRVYTIGEFGEHQQSVLSLRASGEAAMRDYNHALILEQNLTPGDSIVRAYNVHDTKHFSIEQDATISFKVVNGRWILIACLDVARHLGHGPRGPWQSFRSRIQHHGSPFVPTVCHLTLPQRNSIGTGPGDTEKRFAQTAMHCSHMYGQLLNPDLVATDPFYAVTDFLRLSAASTDQFLDLIESGIDQNTGYELFKSQDFGLADLLYYQDLLTRARNRIRHNVCDMRRYRQTWPTTTSDEHKSQTESSVALVVQDFENLQDRIENLFSRCQGAMSMCMNSAGVVEAQRSIEMAKKIQQLSWLAFFYIPLSFSTSFLGMNMSGFGQQNGLSLWVWFVIAFPLLGISYACPWALQEISARLRARRMRITRKRS